MYRLKSDEAAKQKTAGDQTPARGDPGTDGLHYPGCPCEESPFGLPEYAEKSRVIIIMYDRRSICQKQMSLK